MHPRFVMEPRKERDPQAAPRRDEAAERRRQERRAGAEVESAALPHHLMYGSMRWGAVFAGTLVAIGLWFLLHLLGMSVGLMAVDPADPGTLRGVGIGAGIWGILAPIIALFVGGFAAGRVAGVLPRMGAAIHGAVVWALATVATLTLLVWVAGALAGEAITLGAIGATPEVTAQEALAAAPEAGRAMLGLFIAMTLGLAAAVGGTILGVARSERQAARTMAVPAPQPA